MYKVKSLVFLFVVLLSILSCTNNTKTETLHYENQIGDSPFNPELDDASFRFCDSTYVLHKRALINYNDGFKALQEDLINSYKLKESYTSFSGSMIVRFAVNCKGDLGRFRTQIVDSNFLQTEPPKGLEMHVISIIKEMKGWNHAYYKGVDSDCYTFIIVKFKQGKISIE